MIGWSFYCHMKCSTKKWLEPRRGRTTLFNLRNRTILEYLTFQFADTFCCVPVCADCRDKMLIVVFFLHFAIRFRELEH